MPGPQTEHLAVVIDIQANLDRLKELEKQLKANRAELQALTKANQQKRISDEALRSGEQRLAAQAAKLTQETRLLTQLNQAQQAANAATGGSIDDLTARSKALTLQVNALGKAQRQTAEGKELIKQLHATNAELKELRTGGAEATATTKSFAASLLESVENTGLLSGVLGKVKEVQELFAKAQQVATAATEAETGALGGLRAALLSTGLLAVVAVLGSLAALLSKTQAGSDLLAREMGGLSAATDLLTNKATDAAAALFGLADEKNVKQVRTFGDVLQENLVNRLTSGRTVLEGIFNLDAKKLGDGIIQAVFGFRDGVDKAKELGKELDKARESGKALAQQARELARAENDNITTNKTRLNQVERLKNIRDDEFRSIGQRKAANEEAYRIELLRENELVKLAQQRINLRRGELAQAGGRDRDEEKFKALKEAENELADIREDAAGKQNELITNRFQLEQAGAEAERERQRDMVRERQTNLELELLAVEKGSAAELVIRRKQIEAARDLELIAAKQTEAQKKLIRAKADADIYQLNNRSRGH